MIRIIILGALLSLPGTLLAQKIMSDKKDPFDNRRLITTTNVTLINIAGNQVLRAGASARIFDTASTYYLSFLTERLPANIQRSDSLKRECKLKTFDGRILTGKWTASVQLPVGLRMYDASTYLFSETDFVEIANSMITYVKVDESVFEINNKKSRQKLGDLCSLIVDRIKKQE